MKLNLHRLHRRRYAQVVFNRLFITTIVGSFVLLAGLPQSAKSISLTDISPPEGVFTTARPLPLDFGFDDGGSRPWTDEAWRKAVAEALNEWNAVLCGPSRLNLSDPYTVSFKWESLSYFVNTWGSEYQNALAVYVKSEDEIYFNSDIPWDFTLGNTVASNSFGFRWIAKHEIGHALGIAGDWGQVTNRPSWATDDEIMWGVFDSGRAYDGLKPSDLQQLIALGYRVPDAGSLTPYLLAVMAGLFAAARPKKSRCDKHPSENERRSLF